MRQRAFTLIELLVAIGIIAVLAGVVIVAINPTRQLSQADARRLEAGAQALEKGLQQFQVGEEEAWQGMRSAVEGAISTLKTLNGAAHICQLNTPDPNCLDLSFLVPEFIVEIPQDPLAEADEYSGFSIELDAQSRPSVSAVRVANAPSGGGEPSAFAPDDIAGLQLWLDADDAATITIATGVSQWTDKSGVGNTVTQGTSAAQPAVTAGVLNGRNVIRFDGVNDTLAKTSPVGLTNIAGLTLFIVKKNVAYDSAETELAVTNVTGNQRGWLSDFTTAPRNRFSTSVTGMAYVTSTLTPPAANTYYLSIATLNGINQTLTLNGSTDTDAQSSVFASNANLVVGSFIGVSQFLNGDIAEIIFYNRFLSTEESDDVTEYLEDKWGL